MPLSIDLELARNFALALLIGALIGLERERRKNEEQDPTIGGLRTFILFSQVGAASAWLSQQLAAPWIFGVGALCVTALVVAGYAVPLRHAPHAPGLTTEIAALATFLLGGICLAGQPALAVGLGIVTSALLAWKRPLHGLVQRLGEDDLYAGLKLLIASFVVLPLLPREPMDPWGALVPYELWLLVVLISALSLIGYVAVRWLGAQRGTMITGLAGGLVSSTAVTLTFARTGRERAGEASLLSAALLVAWTVMFVRVVVEVVAVNPALVRSLLVPVGAMGAASLACVAWFYLRRERASDAPQVDVALENPFSLRSAISFALVFGLVLLIVALARRYLPSGSMYVIAAVAGLTDVDAITLSMATYARDGGEPGTAITAIVIAVISNTLVKTGMVASLGTPAMRRRVGLAALVIVGAGLAALAL